MKKQKPGYQAYLLRLWCTEWEGTRIWRASLEPAGTNERLGFPSLEKLFAYIRAQTELSEIEPEVNQGGDGRKF